MFLNVQNLFDAIPPASAYYNSPLPGEFGSFSIGDDPTGRYFTMGARYRF